MVDDDGTPLVLTRTELRDFRIRAAGLDTRLPAGPDALARAARPGLQDSVPRAALLALHARADAVATDAWRDPSLVQLWGPRFAAYVVAAADRAVFTLGRLPEDDAARARAERMAARLADAIGDERVTMRRAGEVLGVHPNAVRRAAPTGRVLIGWDGAGAPEVRCVPAPEADPAEARRELARRYLHSSGAGTADGFAKWAGIPRRSAAAVFDGLGPELVPVTTPIGAGRMLAADEPAMRAPASAASASAAPASAASASAAPASAASASAAPAAGVRLLPSGDPYLLLWGRDRELVLPRAEDRSRLWTPRVWPGAVLADGEIVGCWRRDAHVVDVETWAEPDARLRERVEAEAASLPLPGLTAAITVRVK